MEKLSGPKLAMMKSTIKAAGTHHFAPQPSGVEYVQASPPRVFDHVGCWKWRENLGTRGLVEVKHGEATFIDQVRAHRMYA